MTPSKPGWATTGPDDVASPVRNPGTALELDWLEDLARRLPGVGERTAPPPDVDPGSADSTDSLVRVVELLDLTSLNDSDTGETVRTLCARAADPLPQELRARTAGGEHSLHTAAVCVHDRWVPTARAALEGRGVLTAAVTAGFPWPHEDLERRLDEVRATVAAGADEIDLVIDRRHAQIGAWQALYDEVHALRRACGQAHLKAILAAGDLGSQLAVGRAALVCCMAGADFIKTSTGRERVNATLAIGFAMATAILRYREHTGHTVGLKAAGEIRSSRQALQWLQLVRETLGAECLTRDRFRIGASSLLDDLVHRLRAEVGDAGYHGVVEEQ